MIYLRDTNVFSRYLRGEDSRIKEKLEEALRFCRLSSVVLSELEYGAAKRTEVPAFHARISRLRDIIAAEVDYTCTDAYFYGAIRACKARPRRFPLRAGHREESFVVHYVDLRDAGDSSLIRGKHLGEEDSHDCHFDGITPPKFAPPRRF